MADFRSVYLGLEEKQRKRFARLAGTTPGYIETHLLARRKIPRPKLMEGLERASEKCGTPISKSDLLSFFYETQADPIKEKALP